MSDTRTTRGPWFFAAAVLALVGIVASCGSSTPVNPSNSATGTTLVVSLVKEDTSQPRPGGRLTYGLSAETDGWNTTSNRWASSGYVVGFSIFDPLAAYDGDLNPQPYLAKAFEPNADFTDWKIKLRSGVTFQDGTKVDAAAVKKNLEAHRISFLTKDTMSFIESITAVDELTVDVKMSKPWSTFPHILTVQVGVVMAPSMIDNPQGNMAPVGSGPFKFQNWERNRELKVKKNDAYWRKGFPLLNDIVFNPLPDLQARGAALESGSVNIMETNDPQQIIKFTEKGRDGEIQIYTDQKGDAAKIFVGLNTAKPPFDDPIARKAVAYGGNAEQLSQQAYQGVFPAVYGPFNQTNPFYADLGDAYPRYDPVKSKQFAEEYQKKYGKPLEFTANIVPITEVRQVAQVLQQQLAEVGITVIIKELEQINLIVDALSGNYEATGFILFGSPHIDREYAFIASPAGAIGTSSLNFTRIGLDVNGKPNGANDKIVAAMNEARKSADRDKQKAQYRIVQEEMAKNLNFLFLVQQTTAVVFDNNVRGVLKYNLPDASGGKGVEGLPTTAPFTANIWFQA